MKSKMKSVPQGWFPAVDLRPAGYACALLNSQPMGFYAPPSSCRMPGAPGVEVRPIDVGAGDWD